MASSGPEPGNNRVVAGLWPSHFLRVSCVTRSRHLPNKGATSRGIKVWKHHITNEIIANYAPNYPYYRFHLDTSYTKNCLPCEDITREANIVLSGSSPRKIIGKTVRTMARFTEYL